MSDRTEKAARPNKEDDKYQLFDLMEKKNGTTSIPFDHVSYESDLEDYIDKLENSQPLNLEIEQLTKERDELKHELHKKINQKKEYRELFKAEQDKVKELIEFVKEVSEWNKDYSSTRIKLRASDLIKSLKAKQQ